jgi:hypothetical protein
MSFGQHRSGLLGQVNAREYASRNGTDDLHRVYLIAGNSHLSYIDVAGYTERTLYHVQNS